MPIHLPSGSKLHAETQPAALRSITLQIKSLLNPLDPTIAGQSHMLASALKIASLCAKVTIDERSCGLGAVLSDEPLVGEK